MRSSSAGSPKSNSWLPTAAAATPNALNASTTDRPWNWLEIRVPWNSSPPSMSSASPPRSRASRRIASIQPPSQSAPPTGSLVQAERARGAGDASSAPCTSLIPTMTRQRNPLLEVCARSGCCGEGVAQAAAKSRVRKSACRRVMRGIVADRARDGSGLRSENHSHDDSAVTRAPYFSPRRRARAACPGDRRDDGSARPRQRRGREVAPVELAPLLRRARGGDRGPLLPSVLLEAGRPGGRSLLRADGGDHHRLSPLRLAPGVQDQPRLPVRARVLGPDQRAEGNALVGRAPPEPPQVFRPTGGPAQPAARILVEPPGLDPLPALRRAPLARHLRGELAESRLGHAPLRDYRHQPQQRRAGPAHPVFRLVRQPP